MDKIACHVDKDKKEGTVTTVPSGKKSGKAGKRKARKKESGKAGKKGMPYAGFLNLCFNVILDL